MTSNTESQVLLVSRAAGKEQKVELRPVVSRKLSAEGALAKGIRF
jgi:hypothetical protein